ncbi:Tryptophan synthase beta subunit-like PLP-dependent enzyme [Venustampulla echinocandica]|uniref:L-serine ammonia-lyase n=1 Tax=Venustampulla echinocandica TaxID=2656787 RepID=A0A370U099_9HELO|nr:Tryptophan synthase beta subunit-like PLP-dependent enzyme [Venustampulla echinocandica]RDL41183.1 Tryptophan synthase beta subunit-like PLP-dependent enzyme [Venustampulla echinocandica]
MGSNGELPSTSSRPWVETPLIRSAPLSRAAGCNIYLKLETLQPSGSFKSRGIGNLMSQAIMQHGPEKPIRFYCSSGGNAGLACATAALALDRPATIVVPLATSSFMVEKLRALDADVQQVGAHWSEADAFLRNSLLGPDPNGVYVPPFDHPDIWAGNGTIVDEVEEQMQDVPGGYDALVCSVGGGGLLAGLVEGLERHARLTSSASSAHQLLEGSNNPPGNKKPQVLGVETDGASSLALSLRNGTLSTLPTITSIATSLGATRVAPHVFSLTQTYPDHIASVVVSDAEAAMASVYFADDTRMIIEVACGASVAVAYNSPMLRKVLFPGCSDEEFRSKNVVVVVCGGSNVSLQVLDEYRRKYQDDERVLGAFGKRAVI